MDQNPQILNNNQINNPNHKLKNQTTQNSSLSSLRLLSGSS